MESVQGYGMLTLAIDRQDGEVILATDIHLRIVADGPNGGTWEMMGQFIPNNNKLLKDGMGGMDLVDLTRAIKRAVSHEAYLAHRILHLERELQELRQQADKPVGGYVMEPGGFKYLVIEECHFPPETPYLSGQKWVILGIFDDWEQADQARRTSQSSDYSVTIFRVQAVR